MSEPLRDRLAALIAEWRERSAHIHARAITLDHALASQSYDYGSEQTLSQCADAIEAALRAAPEADAFDNAVTAVRGPACCVCGERDDGGYAVEDGPGPFCAECWSRLQEHFLAALLKEHTG